MVDHSSLIDYYTSGSCHELAVALNRNLGWQIALVVLPDAPYWEDESDPGNTLPSVLHAYAVDPDGNAWDIEGVRPADQMVRDAEERFQESGAAMEMMFGEDDLRTYVGYWGDEDEGAIDRPLTDYTDQDVAEAWEHAQHVFASWPQWHALQDKPSAPRWRP